MYSALEEDDDNDNNTKPFLRSQSITAPLSYCTVQHTVGNNQEERERERPQASNNTNRVMHSIQYTGSSHRLAFSIKRSRFNVLCRHFRDMIDIRIVIRSSTLIIKNNHACIWAAPRHQLLHVLRQTSFVMIQRVDITTQPCTLLIVRICYFGLFHTTNQLHSQHSGVKGMTHLIVIFCGDALISPPSPFCSFSFSLLGFLIIVLFTKQANKQTRSFHSV